VDWESFSFQFWFQD